MLRSTLGFAVGVITAFVVPVAWAAPAATASNDPPHVVVVLSGESRDGGKTRPGFEMDELAQAWAIFRDHGIATTFASPRGGKVSADKFDAEDPANARFVADADAMKQLDATVAVADVDASTVDAVYVVGGKGAMFDLATHAPLQRLIAGVYDDGGVVAAVCHGSGALADVKLADGTPLVAGRAVTGFSAEEETIFGKKWAAQFPFQIEDTLRARGARWSEAFLMMPNTVIDGRLVTGQNPYSTGGVAEGVVRALGLGVKPREPRRDEASMALVARAVAGDAVAAAAALAATPGRYQVELIGLLGYYQLKVAKDDAEVRAALVAMDLAAPHMAAPELAVGRADAMHRLGRADEAKRLVDGVLATKPDMAEAVALKQQFDAGR